MFSYVTTFLLNKSTKFESSVMFIRSSYFHFLMQIQYSVNVKELISALLGV